MKAKILKASFEALSLAKKIIKEGGLVAFPTETVYGLGANVLDPSAVQKIFEAKGRPADNPLIVHVFDKEQIAPLVREITPLAKLIIDNLMPSSITIVLNKSDIVPNIASGGLDTVAIRMPKHEVALKFLESVALPIAAPSANTSKRPSPTSAQHVFEDLGDKIPLIIDGGKCEVGIESTVVDVRGDVPIILRKGKILARELEKLCGSVQFAQKSKLSPGTRYLHYAPKCECWMFEFGEIPLHFPKNSAILCSYETSKKLDGENVFSMGKNAEECAQNLYDMLLKLEKSFDCILIEKCQDEGMGVSVNDRIFKASGGKKLKKKVLFVCTGNTCRSIMAENILNHLLKKQNRHDIAAFSAGVFANEREIINPFAREVLQNHKIEISNFQSKKIDKLDYDLILTMTSAHKKLLPKAENIFSADEFCGLGEIDDPFGQTAYAYEKTYDKLLKLCENILQNL